MRVVTPLENLGRKEHAQVAKLGKDVIKEGIAMEVYVCLN